MTPSQGLVPQSIFAGQFRVVGQLARGGMGTIYQVEQLPTGHPRALKVILPEYAQDPRARARFEQEAQQRGGELDQIAVNGETLAPPDAIAPPPSGMLPPGMADAGAPAPPEDEASDESMDEVDEAD